MAMNSEHKERIIDILQETKRKGHRLFIILKFQGNGDGADLIDAGCRRLSEEIDELLGQLMREWLGSAEEVIAERKKANEKLQASINKIKKKQDIANNLVKALGFIDDAVAAAAKLLTP